MKYISLNLAQKKMSLRLHVTNHMILHVVSVRTLVL
jgi:hypothetical protein